MEINLLYFDDCPSWAAGLENLKAALLAEALEADIHLIKVETDNVAAERKFLGSPSFQVDGLDRWWQDREEYNLSCRLYATPHGIQGVPGVEMFRERLRTLRS